MATELAQAYIQIMPSMKGMQEQLTKEFGGAAEKAGDNAGQAGGSSFLGKLGKVVAGGAAAALAGLTAAAGTLVSNVSEVAAYGDEIDKMSQKLGLSTKAYQEWDYVLGQAGADITSMSTGLKTLTNKLDDAKNGSTTAQEMFAKLGLSMEDLNSMSREDIFENVIYGFQGMADSTERAALANDLFGRSGQELTPLFNSSVEDTKALIEASNELGFVMSDEAVKASADYKDALDTMTRTIGGLKNNLLGEFMPSLTTVMDGLTQIFGGDSESGIGMIKDGVSGFMAHLSEALPQVLKLGVGIVTSLSTAIIDNLPQIMSAGMDALFQFVGGLLDQLPQLLEAGLTLIITLGEGIAEQLPTFIDNALEGVLSLVDTLMDNLGPFIESGINIISSLLDGIIEAVPKIVEYIPQLITTLITGIVENLPRILESGVQLIVTLVQGLISAIPTLVANIPQIIAAIWNGITSINWLELGKNILFGIINGIISMVGSLLSAAGELISNLWNAFTSIDWLGIGSNIIDGIKNGVVNAAGRLWEAAKNAVSNALAGVKRFLGIASPSKVFEKQIGMMIPLGMAEGIEGETNAVRDAVEDLGKEAIGSFDADFTYDRRGMADDMTDNNEALFRVILQAANMIVASIDNKEIPGGPSDAYIGKVALQYQQTMARRGVLV